MQAVAPITAIVPTKDRSISLSKMVSSLAQQSVIPCEFVVIDASTNRETEELCREISGTLDLRIVYLRAAAPGAALQRNEGVTRATQQAILFLDDDITFETNCIERLWAALNTNPRVGGVNAMITNQRYTNPGLLSRLMFALMSGRIHDTYAGKCIGPGLNLLPEDRPDLPEVVPVEWMNTTCTLYRRAALPTPVFPAHFVGYSLFEDLALSLTVGKRWSLRNARTARIYHDSQPGAHKSDPRALAEMEFVNRHYVMTEILGRRNLSNYVRLVVWELFQLGACAARSNTRSRLFAMCSGKLKGIGRVLRPSGSSRSGDLAPAKD